MKMRNLQNAGESQMTNLVGKSEVSASSEVHVVQSLDGLRETHAALRAYSDRTAKVRNLKNAGESQMTKLTGKSEAPASPEDLLQSLDGLRETRAALQAYSDRAMKMRNLQNAGESQMTNLVGKSEVSASSEVHVVQSLDGLR